MNGIEHYLELLEESIREDERKNKIWISQKAIRLPEKMSLAKAMDILTIINTIEMQRNNVDSYIKRIGNTFMLRYEKCKAERIS